VVQVSLTQLAMVVHVEQTRSAVALHAVDAYCPVGQLIEQAWQLPLLEKKPLSQLATPHVPLVQAGEPFATVQVVPHAPQCATSLLRSMQAPSQAVCPTGQLAAQTPAAHTWPLAHAWPQEPQLAGSLCRSWQAESLQLTLPGLQVVPELESPQPASTPTNSTESHQLRFTAAAKPVCMHTLLVARISPYQDRMRMNTEKPSY
jgi:hypothetical protein